MTATTRRLAFRPLPRSQDRLLVWLLVVALAGAVLQITMGGVVRVTGSGDGCPDWPACFGRWIPPLEYHALLEYTHRTIGTLVGIVIIGAVARAWLRHRDNRPALWSATSALVLISIVGGVGGAVVLSELDPALRTLHLALAEMVVLLLAFSLTAATHRAAGGAAAGQGPALRLAAAAAGLTLAALLAGSYAVWRGAGAVCASWPLCGGPLVPDNELAWVHMFHRLVAGVSVLAVLWAAHRVYRLAWGPPALRAVALGGLVLAAAQVIMGALNPWTDFSQWARAGHLSLATLVWLDTLLMVFLIRRPLPAAGAVEESAA